MEVKYIGRRQKIVAHGYLFTQGEPLQVRENIARRLVRNRFFEEHIEEPAKPIEPKPIIAMRKAEMQELLKVRGIAYEADAKRPELMRLLSGN